MADKLLFRFKLNDELKKAAGPDGDIQYEVREIPGRPDRLAVWWGSEDDYAYNVYTQLDVKRNIDKGSWIKLEGEQ